MDSNSLHDENSYYLRLGNDQEWYFAGTGWATPLVEKLAKIMNLKIHNGRGARRFILTQRELGGPSKHNYAYNPDGYIRMDIPADREPWMPYFPRILRVLSCRDLSETVFELAEVDHNFDHLTPSKRDKIMRLSDLRILRRLVYSIFQQVQDLGGLPFHSAFAEWNNMGVLMAGRGGAGKSTCYRRLPPKWHALSDDEALVVRDGRGQYLVHPLPTWSSLFNGESDLLWHIQQSYPLRAIFFVQRAKTNEVVPLSKLEAAAFINESASQIWQACTWNHMSFSVEEELPHRRQVFDISCQIATSVPAFILRASLTGRFWEKIEEVLSELPKTVNVGDVPAS